MTRVPNPFEDFPEAPQPVRPKRAGDPFEALGETESSAEEAVLTLCGGSAAAAEGPKPLLADREDSDLVEWMLGVGRFFAAAGVALCRGVETPELARARDRALRWAAGFDILEADLRETLIERLREDDRFEPAPEARLLEAALVTGESERRDDVRSIHVLYGFTAADEFEPDHLGRELLFYGLLLERLHEAGAEGRREAVEALFGDALDFLSRHLDWLGRIPLTALAPEARLLVRVAAAVVAAERSLTIA